MKQKLVFLDVDGTLNLPSLDVTPKVKQAIKQARENGHLVFLCTGRNKAGISSLLDIGFDGYIASAGGYIVIDDEVIDESYLSEEDLKEARDVFEKLDVHYNLEASEMTYQGEDMNRLFIEMNGTQMNSEMERLLQQQTKMFNIHTFDEFNQDPRPIHKMCFIAKTQDQVNQIKEQLGYKYNVIIHDFVESKYINGEIIIKNTDKGQAIEKIVGVLGKSLEDTIGFGDSMNDLEMIKTCQIGVVMANGNEKLKEYSDVVCESVSDDGIYHEFKRQGLI